VETITLNGGGGNVPRLKAACNACRMVALVTTIFSSRWGGSDTLHVGFGSGMNVVNNYENNSSGRFDRILVGSRCNAQDVLCAALE